MKNILQDREALEELMGPLVANKNKSQVFVAQCDQCQQVKLNNVSSQEYQILCASVLNKRPYICSDECERAFNKTKGALLDNLPTFDDEFNKK